MKVTKEDIDSMISGLKCLMSSSKYAYDTCGFVDHKGKALDPAPGSTRYCHEVGVLEANRLIEILKSLETGGSLQIVFECERCGMETSDPEFYDTNPSWVGEVRDVLLCRTCYRKKIA